MQLWKTGLRWAECSGNLCVPSGAHKYRLGEREINEASPAGVALRRLSLRHKRWLLIHAKAAERRRLRENMIRAARRRFPHSSGGRFVSMYGPEGFTYVRLTGQPRRVPNNLSLIENPDETIEFLRDLKTGLDGSVVRNRRGRRSLSVVPSSINSYWDFCNIERISPLVALMIASQYDRVVRKGGWVIRPINIDRWDRKVFTVLLGIGFFEILGIVRKDSDIVGDEEASILKFQAGSKADGPRVGDLLKALDVPEIFENDVLYSVIVEGLVNTVHHAYPEGVAFPEPHVGGWWMSAFVDRTQRRVRIAIYDHGVGIPATLPQWSQYDRLKRGWRLMFGGDPELEVNGSRDGTAIALAMVVGRSSTKQDHRGRGLPFMESLLDLCVDGSISIYSRRGSYHRKKGGRPQHYNRNVEVAGTLVVWTLGY